ncbi:MAG: T9SS type A sorting domain-containing protein, partial [Bacteroidota bacterium]|nr:T9SS type A sorting domain-containing protein [Bacteroidota bacterium]
GVYTYSSSNSLGCDSIATLNLTINPSTTSLTNEVACDSFEWNGITYNESGVYTYSTNNSLGCDSIATLNLTINPSTTSSTNEVACDSFEWNGTTYTESGVYTYSTSNSLGCDSIAIIDLTIENTDTVYENITACNEYNWTIGSPQGSGVYSQSGIYYGYEATGSVCASEFHILELIIHESSSSFDTVIVCDQFEWEGILFTESGNYTTSYLDANGCDSVLNLFLTVNESSDTIFTSVITCQDYEWFDETYSSPGLYVHETTNNQGCTEIHVLELNSCFISDCINSNDILVNAPGEYFPDTITNLSPICAESIYNQTIQFYVPFEIGQVTGYPYFSEVLNLLLDISNLIIDSVVLIDILGLPDGLDFSCQTDGCVFLANSIDCFDIFGSTDELGVHDLTFVFDGYSTVSGFSYNYYNSTNEYLNISGYQIEVYENQIITQDIVTCESYTWNGQTYYESGTYFYTSNTINNCDSTNVLNLTINSASGSSDIQTHCNQYTWIDGNTYTESNTTATWTVPNATNCDSVITLDLTINYTTTVFDTIHACDTYTWMDGVTYTQSGDYSYIGTNSDGCPETNILTLIINESSQGLDEQNHCDEYTWIDGNTYTESNSTATWTVPNSTNCDSVITLNLTINYSTTVNDTVTACDSYTWMDGISYTQSGDYTYIGTNADNCPEINILTLAINESSQSLDVQSHCDEFTWIDGNTYTESNTTATWIVPNATNCDSIISLDLTINYSTTVFDTIYACDTYTWLDSVTYTESGDYTFIDTNAYGCLETNILALVVNESSQGIDEQTHCNQYTWIDGNTYTESNSTATWTVPNATNCDSVIILNLTIQSLQTSYSDVLSCGNYLWNDVLYTETGNYTFLTQTDNGCDSIAYLDLTISNLEDLEIIGQNIAYTQSSNNQYAIVNPTQGSIYHWNMSEGLGVIENANTDSSEIEISWGTNDLIEVLCVYEEDIFGCAGDVMCIVVDIRNPLNVVERDPTQLNIFPNPFSDETTISFSNPSRKMVHIQITDTRGKLVREYLNINSNKVTIKKEELAKGLYYVQLKLNNQLHRATIVIQ